MFENPSTLQRNPTAEGTSWKVDYAKLIKSDISVCPVCKSLKTKDKKNEKKWVGNRVIQPVEESEVPEELPPVVTLNL